MRKWIIAGLTAVVLQGCQTTGVGTLYSRESLPSEPRRENYKSDLEYAIDLTIFMYPRRCAFVHTSDGVRIGNVMRPEEFTFTQIISNKHDKHWFRSTVRPTNAEYNALTFYANGWNGKWACGADALRRIAPEVQFEADKFYEVANIKTPATIDPGAKSESARLRDGDTRAIAMSWEGHEELIAGVITMNQSRNGGSVRLTLPNKMGTCAGDYAVVADREGTWKIACTNGETASGTFKGYGSGKGSSGVGTDSKGRKVSYTIGDR
jgi:hypothetical protein